MAKSRRPTDLGSAFGSLLRSTLQQLDTVREVVVQKTKEGRAQLDLTLLKRKRKDALAKIGEAVVRLARDGRITEDDYPEIGEGLAALEAIDEKIAAEGGAVPTHGPHGEEDDDGVVSSASWKRAAGAASDREEYDDDDDADDDDDDDDDDAEVK